MIQELHTTDMTTNCLHAVKLTHEGKRFGETTGALYLGNVFHAAVQAWHHDRTIDHGAIDAMTLTAAAFCDAQAKEEGRPLSKATVQSRSEHLATVSNWLYLYAGRFMDEPIDVIGTEVPIRLTIDVDGEPQEFASHLDLLARHRKTKRLIVRDWKTGEESPTAAYLVRNIQLGLYYLAVAEGHVLLDATMDHWQNMGEYPTIQWCHVRSLEPYKRAVTDKETGEVQAKGAARPLDKILYEPPFSPAGRAEIIADLTTRVRLVRANLYPKNPDPLGCHLCECRGACRNFLGGENE